MEKDLRDKTMRGMVWTVIERLSSQVVQFVIGIVLARLLSPSDYGVIGLLAVFLAVAQAFLTSGFGSALIQKKDRNDDDYCTCFIFNMLVSVSLYAVMVLFSPLIAKFYHMPILEAVTPVISLGLIFNALLLVQTTRFTIELDFRTQTVATVLSMVISGIVGIYLAYSGYGVWALVWQSTISSVVRVIYLWEVSSWRPKMRFSKKSFSALWGFGSKILVASLIDTVYTNIHSLVIGRFYKPADLGNFNRAKNFASLPGDVIFYTLAKVNYPVLAKLQDNRDELLRSYKRLLQIPLFLMYPTLVGMAAVAEPLIKVLIGDKWIGCAPLLVILCFSWIAEPLTSTNLKLLYAIGRSDCVLKLELVKKPLAFLILATSLPFGVLPLCVGYLVYNILAFAINCHYTKRYLDFGFLRQTREVLPILLNSMAMFAVVKLVSMLFVSPIWSLTVGVVIGVVSYFLLAFILKDESLAYFNRIVKDRYYALWTRMQEKKRYGRNAVPRLKRAYAKTLVRLSVKYKKRQLKVVFIVSETSKWKTQSLYELLDKSSHFDPVVALTMPKNMEQSSDQEIEARMAKDEEYYHSQGLRTCRAYDPKSRRFMTIKQLGADIVFYQQPCLGINEQNPFTAGESALTFYVPYYLPTYGEPDIDCRPLFQRSVFGHIVLDKRWADYYRNAVKDLPTAGEILPLGHTMLDNIRIRDVNGEDGEYIIYAPHFTFSHPNNKTSLHYSTFAENGDHILEYAREHREFKWVFKPHPSLRHTLVTTGAMTEVEADAYYDAWREIGKVCLDGSYPEYFSRSRAMITDCGSFLVEYGITYKPVIHLVSKELDNSYRAPFSDLYASYYQVRNIEEMLDVFKLVIEERKDPERDRRHRAVSQVLALDGSCAGENILRYLDDLFNRAG